MLFRDEEIRAPHASQPPHSDDLDAESEARTGRGTLYRLLDPAFGFGIWAVHFLLVYCSTAVYCALGARATGLSAFHLQVAQVAITIAAAAIVFAHALRKYRLDEGFLDGHFLVWITIGHDALASIGILWMLMPILLVPACS